MRGCRTSTPATAALSAAAGEGGARLAFRTHGPALAPHGQSDSAAFLSLVETASLRHGEICFAHAKLALQADDP